MQPSADPQSLESAELAALVARLTDDLWNHSSWSDDDILRQHPEHAAQLRELLPTIRVIARLPRPELLQAESADEEAGLVDPAHRLLSDYRILREAGRGGMGVVYEAHQISLDRRVALKLLPFAAIASDQQLKRFKNESRVAASLLHPHIVPVFAVGCENGIHFYTMQFIDGPTLADVLQELRSATVPGPQEGRSRDAQTKDLRLPAPSSQAHADASDGLDTIMAETVPHIRGDAATWCSKSPADHFRTVARWGTETAEALAYAHANGVLHRDIKPGNLMLDKDGKLWVTDFGLARLEQDASITLPGNLIGTLRYMAPEQALAKPGPVDHRADIYSLGATLYELLTLRPAFDGRDRRELLEQIAFSEPRPVRSLNRSIPGELETIVLKCMAKLPHERYATADELADDLNRYLDRRPILARPPSLLDRAMKWSQRHRALVGGLLAMLLLALVGLGIGSGLIYRQKQIADHKSAEAERQRQRAEKSLGQALQAVDSLLRRVENNELMNAPRSENLRRQLLEDALAICQSLLDEEGDHPEVRLRTAVAQQRMGSIQILLGNDDEARQVLEQSIQEMESWLTAHRLDPQRDDYARLLAGSFGRLGALRFGLEDFQPAISAENQGIRILEELAQRTGRPEDRCQLSQAYVQRGNAEHRVLAYVSARESFQSAGATLRALIEEFPDNPEYRVKLAWCYHAHACTLRDEHDPRDEEYYEKAIQLFEQWSDKVTDVAWAKHAWARSLLSYGQIIRDDEQWEKALGVLQKGRELCEPLWEQFPDVPAYSETLTRILQEIYFQLFQLARFDEAEQALALAISRQRTLVSTYPERPHYRSGLASILHDYGALLERMGNREQALQATQESIELTRTLIAEGADSLERKRALAQGLNNLAVMTLRKDAQKAVDACREAIAQLEPMVDQFPDNVDFTETLVSSYLNLSSSLHQLQDWEQKAAVDQRALLVAQKLAVDYPHITKYEAQLAAIQSNLATQQAMAGDYAAAAEVFQQAVETYHRLQSLQPANPSFKSSQAQVFVNLARIGIAEGDAQRAEKHLAKALHIWSSLVTQNSSIDDQHEFARVAFLRMQIQKRFASIEQITFTYNDMERVLQKCSEWHPEDAELKQGLVRLRTSLDLARTKSMLAAGDYRQAMDAVDGLRDGINTESWLAYDAAAILALVADDVMQDQIIDVQQQSTERERCLTRSLELLKTAQSQQFFLWRPFLDYLQVDEDFQALRDDPRFREFLRSLNR